ncbi:MAG: nucleotidyltransferase domain-containing protein [Nitrospinae bacterium]|nr:nucleotidyltransferase domain-containing protein [Nitrospinota bacterium]
MSILELADPVLSEIVSRLVKTFKPDKIYLFGSKARGDFGQDSDYDILIVVPDEAEQARRKSRTAYQALRGTRAAADVIVQTRHEFESRLRITASLQATVAREGKLLYAA